MISSVLRFFLSASSFSTLTSIWFPIFLFRLSILGFLFVSFQSILIRSHSCFTGDSLLPLPCVRFFVGTFCDLSIFFRPSQFASNYSALWPFFSLLLDFPCQRFFRCFSSSSVQPVAMLSFRLWYSASCDSFLRSLFRITGTTSMSQLFPCGSQLISLGLRFRFRIFGFRIFSLSRLIQLFFLVFPKQLRYINNIQHTCQQLF